MKDGLIPIALDGPVAPDHILNVIRCKCKGNCSSTLCSCRKHGLQCVTACSNCHGTDCTNMQTITPDDGGDSEPETLTKEIFNDDCGEVFWNNEFNLNVHYEEEVECLYEEEVQFLLGVKGQQVTGYCLQALWKNIEHAIVIIPTCVLIKMCLFRV